MDPFSIAVGIIGILQATKSCLKFSRKFAGPSQFGASELDGMKNSLYEFYGIMKTFQTHLDIYEDDENHLQALEHLKPAMLQCQTAVHLIKEYLQDTGFMDKALKGAKFDKKLKQLLKTIEESGKLFKIAVLADQQSIMLSVRKYIDDMGQDLRDVRSEQEDTRAATLYNNVRNWLDAQSDNDVNSQWHKDNVSNRHPGSGRWLVEHPSFLNWFIDDRRHTYNTLWLKGSPGAGKSYVCSAAIEYISEHQQLFLYYFCRFDDASTSRSSGNGTASSVRTAAILIDQLFRHFWQDNRQIAEAVSRIIQTADKNMSTLREVAKAILNEATKSGEDGSSISTDPVKLYLLLDGLDEDKHFAGAQGVIDLFQSLEINVPLVMRLWISSRHGLQVRHRYDEFSTINLDEFAEPDVQSYLVSSIVKLKYFDDENTKIDGIKLREWVLKKLQLRAGANFLYAMLTIERLSDGVFNVDDITALVTSSVPDNFTDIYQRILGQYQRDQHRYVSLLFSFVTFARRPLYLKEILEAMTLALSDSSKGLDRRRAPLSLERLFPPLIETQRNSRDPRNPLCRLCHATVHEFLVSNPRVLGNNFEISPSVFGNICLRYLSQPRYSSLIQDSQVRKTDVVKNSISPKASVDTSDHALLTYCAKFWYKHLEDVDISSIYFQEVCNFLESPNFQTLLQVQSVAVEFQFSKFMVGDRIVRRQALPWWLDEERPVGDETRVYPKYRKDYRHFINEWGYLLDTGICLASDPLACTGDHFHGQIDRCLSGLLGPQSFMSKMLERHSSFMLSQGGFDYSRQGVLTLSEGVSPTQDCFILVSCNPSDKSQITMESWKLRDVAVPSVLATTSITAPGLADLSMEPTHRIHLSQESTYLQVQSWLVATGESRPFLEIPGVRTNDESPLPHAEDIERKGDTLVVTSRWKKHGQASDIRTLRRLKNASSEDINPLTQSQSEFEDESTDESDGGIEGDKSMISSSSSEYNSADETCSEGSTEVDTDDDDDAPSDFDSPSEASDATKDSDSDRSLSPDHDSLDNGTGDSILDISLTPQQLVDGDIDFEGKPLKQSRSRPTFSGSGRRLKAQKDRVSASISVFKVSGPTHTRVFHYEQEIPHLLYHSGPVFHPFKSLIVWPLAGGQILFADYSAKTYFVRGSMASTRDSRHISVKCHFSDCGKYLHIASLEGRIVSENHDERKSEGTSSKGVENDEAPKAGGSNIEGRIVLSLFLTTHRLSERKTTRSPPRLQHKVRISMGNFAGLSLRKLPFTFTWSPEFLYFTISGCQLNVLRVHLFADRAGGPKVTIPRLPVMLPQSAAGRQIYYLPANGRDKRALVLMGSYPGNNGVRVQLKSLSAEAITNRLGDGNTSQTLDYPCPPVGLYLHEDLDFDGWAASNAEKPVAKGEKYRDGRLIWNTEHFSYDDDIDLEGICDICESPMYYSTS